MHLSLGVWNSIDDRERESVNWDVESVWQKFCSEEKKEGANLWCTAFVCVDGPVCAFFCSFGSFHSFFLSLPLLPSLSLAQTALITLAFEAALGKKKKERKKRGEAEVIVSSGFNFVRCNCWQTANLHKLNIFAYVHLGEGEKKQFALIKHLKINHIMRRFVISIRSAQAQVPQWR